MMQVRLGSHKNPDWQLVLLAIHRNPLLVLQVRLLELVQNMSLSLLVQDLNRILMLEH
jgi:hypothetical protein